VSLNKFAPHNERSLTILEMYFHWMFKIMFCSLDARKLFTLVRDLGATDGFKNKLNWENITCMIEISFYVLAYCQFSSILLKDAVNP
jgi:hypothetical protein